jgi:CheY-like chemotaxis protein
MKSQDLLLEILIADDDKDDCLFFQEALSELPVSAKLSMVHDGEELMHHLNQNFPKLPFALFLDLNMPRKDGYSCLKEIKSDKKLNRLPVVIFSTSFSQVVAEELYNHGADFYLCKPAHFGELKNAIERTLKLLTGSEDQNRSKENFLIVKPRTTL